MASRIPAVQPGLAGRWRKPGIHHLGEAIHHEVREAGSSAFRNGPRDHAWRWSEHAGRRYEPVSPLVVLARLRRARSRRADALARPTTTTCHLSLVNAGRTVVLPGTSSPERDGSVV